MIATPGIDIGLLRRYDGPGPRYTSYPPATRFDQRFGERQFRDHAAESNGAPIPGGLSLYVHVPFCFSPCFYCGCTRIITRDRSRGAAYLRRIEREIALIAPLFDRDREVLQLHLGGGTPNFLDLGEIERLLATLGGAFSFGTPAGRDFSIELDPRTLTAGDAARLGALGFNRASLGVQDFDPDVQRAVNRLQGVEQTLAVIEACRSGGTRSVNVDLIYGLPRQTLEGFARTLYALLTVRPDRFAIYGYAHLPELFKAQRQIDRADLPDPGRRLELLHLAVETLVGRGYHHIGMDHFAVPEDDLSKAREAGGLHRNFMGYTTYADCDLIGFGMSAISHVGDSYSQNYRDLGAWERAVDAGQLPVWRGIALDADDRLRADVIQGIMCRGAVDIERVEADHAVEFKAYFADALARLEPLVADGLVTVGPRRIVATEPGRYLLRSLAMCFDRSVTDARVSRHSSVV